MIRRPIGGRATIVLGVVGVLLLVSVYAFLSHRQHQKNPNDRTIPTATQLAEGVTRAFTTDPATGKIWVVSDGAATASRLFLGLLLAVVGAVLIGYAMGCYPPVAALLHPPVSFLGKIPPTAMLAVFFVTVGVNFELYAAMIVFGVLPALTQTLYHAAKEDVPDELIYKAHTLGATQAEIVANIIFRQTLPKLIDGVRLAVGPAMVFLIAAEWIAADVGFGHRIKLLSRQVDMRVVYVYLAILGATGFGLDLFLAWLRRRLCPWYEEAA